METMEGELQSGYLTGTKPTAAQGPKGGGGGVGIQSIHTLLTICSLMYVCVLVCESAEPMRNTSCKADVHLGHTHTTERSSILLVVHTVTNGLRMLKYASLWFKEHFSALCSPVRPL